MTTPGTAKYGRIADDLIRRINEGEFASGGRLPSQQAMSDEYDVTVMTIRQALSELVADGLLYTSHGRGTFVSDRQVQYRLGPLAGFTHEMRAQGLDVKTRVLSMETGRDDQEVRDKLGVDPDDGITRIERLRVLHGKPVIYQVSFLSDELGRRLTKKELVSKSLYEILQHRFGIEVVRAEETLRAVTLAENASVLEREPGSPAFLSIRATIGSENRCVLFDRAYLPGDSAEVKADRLTDRHHVLFQIDSARSS